MWEQVDHWLQWHKKWMTDKFLELDAEGIETDTTTIYRVLVKCEKTFEAQKLDGCLNVCRTILEQVNGFRPHVPLIIALRQQGIAATPAPAAGRRFALTAAATAAP